LIFVWALSCHEYHVQSGYSRKGPKPAGNVILA